MNRNGVKWIIILIAVMVYACGYRFAGGGVFPSGVETIFIKDFKNRTADTGIESIVTNQIIFEFTRRNKNGLAANKDTADAVMTGVITKEKIRTISTKGQDSANERRVTLWIDLKLTKPNGNVVWVNKNLSDNETYKVDAEKLQTERNRKEAIGVLSGRMAERAYSRLTDDF